MAMNLAPVLKQRFFDANGNPLAGGKLYTYQAGTTTPLATYTDSTGGTPNANPVVLDANGEANVWINPLLTYKLALTDSAGTPIWTTDNVSGTNSLADGTVTAAKLADDAVTADKLKDDAEVDANRAVSTNHIKDSAVTTAKILNANVTAAKLATDSVETLKIKDLNVTTAKLADFAITPGKKAALGQQLSGSTNAYGGGNTSGQYSDVPNLSVTITTTGRPVFVMLSGDGSGELSYLNIATGGAVNELTLVRDSTTLNKFPFYLTEVNRLRPAGILTTVDVVAAGQHTYKVQIKTDSIHNINYVKLVAFEL